MPETRIREKTRILFAEDQKIHYMMALEILRVENIDFEPRLVDTRGDFSDALREFNPDIVITDYQMRGFNGMDALKMTLQYDPTIPVIILTGSISEEVAVECMRAGATNYVLKENLIRLPFAYNDAIEKKINQIERNKAIQAQQESESKLQAITKAAGDAIILMDDKGSILFWNPAAARIFGYSEPEILGKDILTLFPSKVHHETFALNLARSQKEDAESNTSQTAELEAHRKDGSPIFISLNLASVIINGCWHAVGIISDITVRKRAEQEIFAAKERVEASDKLKTAFINNISHELRTPLNGIIGFTELITKPDVCEDDRVLYHSIIKSSSKRLLETMTSYMDISMIVTGNMVVQPKPFDLNQLLQSIHQQFLPVSRIKNLELKLRLPDDSDNGMMVSDCSLLNKVLVHLIDNALKFTRQGDVSIGYTRFEDEIRIFVADTGIGIEKEMQQRIFDQFIQVENSNTRGFDGSGLGLSIVQGLTRLLGGSVEIKSEPGEGSKFTIIIPFSASGPEIGQPLPVEKCHPRVKIPLILVAEDDETNYLYLKAILNRLKLNVIWAADGSEAVRQCQDHPDLNLVFMDVKMPVMDGLEATRNIKSTRPDLPVIAITAFAMTGDEKTIREAGCDNYLSKPIHEELIHQMVSTYLGIDKPNN